MAATWETSITVTNRAEKRISVSSTRTDGEDVRTVGPLPAKYDPGDGTFAAFLQEVAVRLKAKLTKEDAATAADDLLIGTAEADISAALVELEA